MPKNKTHSGAKKHFRVTGSGKFVREQANKRHLLEYRSSRCIRRLAMDQPVDVANLKSIKRLLGRWSQKEKAAVRVKRAVNAIRKRRTTPKHASGYRGQRSRLYRKAKEQATYSFVYNYRNRRARKHGFRKLWIARVNAVTRAKGLAYNHFIQGLTLMGIEADRRQLAEMAVNDPKVFAAVVAATKRALPEDVSAPKQT